MTCAYCKNDPGVKAPGSVVWNGFQDKDTGQYVCMPCRPRHYRAKFAKAALRGLYSEFPVVIATPTHCQLKLF